MSLLRLQKRLIYLLVAIPFLLLVLGGEMNPVISVGFTVAMLWSWFWESPRVDLSRYRTLWTAITVLVLLTTLGRYLAAGEFFIEPLVDLVLILTALKLMQREGAADYTQLSALAFLMLVAGSAFNPDILFGLAFIGFMVVVTIALSVQHLREELDEHHPARLEQFRVERRFMVTVGSLAFVVSIISIAFFLLFPRMGFGLFNQFGRSPLESTGFNEEISLDDHGTMRENAQIAMRVRMLEGEERPDELRMRVMSFNHYDGVRWGRTGRSYEFRDGLKVGPIYSANGRIYDRSRYNNRAAHDALTYGEVHEDIIAHEIILEPIAQDYLPGMPQMVALSYPDEDPDLPRSAFRQLTKFSFSGDVKLERETLTGIRYHAYSLAELVPRAVLFNDEHANFWNYANAPDSPPWTGRLAYNYLQMPDVFSDDIGELAYQVIGDAQTPLERARRIEAFLRAEFEYSLEAADVDDTNPVEEFLFDTRRGHCEYFSTSMVMMLRAVGIPSRNVGGYLGGDWNDTGQYYQVRQSHAHSWVEAWLPNAGWITFDPTPPAGLPVISDEGFWTSILFFFDNIRMFWYQNVVDFNLENQISMAKAVVDTVGGNPDYLIGNLRLAALRLWRNGPLLAGLVLLWAMGLGFFVWRKRSGAAWSATDTGVSMAFIGLSGLLAVVTWRGSGQGYAAVLAVLVPSVFTLVAWANRRAREVRRQGRRRTRPSRASRLFLHLVRTMARAGYDYDPGDTPSRLLAQAKARGEGYSRDLERVIERYQRCRFAAEPEVTAVKQLKQAVRALERRVRSAS